MNVPFNVGDPVQVARRPNRLGKVVGIIEPTFDAMGAATRLGSVAVQPVGRKYTTVFYDECELLLCRCADRNRKETTTCHEKSVPF